MPNCHPTNSGLLSWSTEDISEMQEYMQSDEYLEKVAKDKLGLVKDGEIIFKESN